MMGTWIIKNYIEISDKTKKGGVLEEFSYKDINENFIHDILSNIKEIT